jgi:two-component system C4-dicarboxylate transport response regulator DctD
MAQLATNTRMPGRFLHLMPEHLVAARHVRALVVSSELEVRKPLLRSLQRLQVDTIVCADLREAEEVLSEHFVGVVFCDDRLPDGWYSDLLRPSRSRSKAPRIVVTTRTGDWELYFEALEKGAFDVIQSPCYSTHVEMTIARLLRDEEARLEYCSSR